MYVWINITSLPSQLLRVLSYTSHSLARRAYMQALPHFRMRCEGFQKIWFLSCSRARAVSRFLLRTFWRIRFAVLWLRLRPAQLFPRPRAQHGFENQHRHSGNAWMESSFLENFRPRWRKRLRILVITRMHILYYSSPCPQVKNKKFGLFFIYILPSGWGIRQGLDLNSYRPIERASGVF